MAALVKVFLIIAFGAGGSRDLKLHVGDIDKNILSDVATSKGKDIGKYMVLEKVNNWEDKVLIDACSKDLIFDQKPDGNYEFTCNVVNNNHNELGGYKKRKNKYTKKNKKNNKK